MKDIDKELVTYGVDSGNPSGDETALTIKIGNKLFTYIGEEAEAILQLINQARIDELSRLDRSSDEMFQSLPRKIGERLKELKGE